MLFLQERNTLIQKVKILLSYDKKSLREVIAKLQTRHNTLLLSGR